MPKFKVLVRKYEQRWVMLEAEDEDELERIVKDEPESFDAEWAVADLDDEGVEIEQWDEADAEPPKRT